MVPAQLPNAQNSGRAGDHTRGEGPTPAEQLGRFSIKGSAEIIPGLRIPLGIWKNNYRQHKTEKTVVEVSPRMSSGLTHLTNVHFQVRRGTRADSPMNPSQHLVFTLCGPYQPCEAPPQFTNRKQESTH
jgi:hypothetical protein